MRPHKIASGQALVEFALIFPLLFFLVSGLFDIGRAIFYYSILNTAVREGTRYAIVQPDYILYPDPFDCNEAPSTADIRICDEIKNKFFTGELTSSTITILRGPGATGDPSIKINIEFTFEPITPGVAFLGRNLKAMEGLLTMNVNSQMLIAPIAEP